MTQPSGLELDSLPLTLRTWCGRYTPHGGHDGYCLGWGDGRVGVGAAPLCPTTFPEPHGLGEFPMTCYRCHIDADS